MNKKWMNGITQTINTIFAEPVTKYVVIITSIISILMITQALVDGNTEDGRFLSMADKQLAINFVEWFGVLYGFLLPTILVRVWEQFDEIDNVLDREADAVEILVGDLQFLDEQHDGFKEKVLSSLETYSTNVVRFVKREMSPESERQDGDDLLKQIRTHYMDVFRKRGAQSDESDVLKDELLHQLNNIIDHRGDRISLSTQRLFESLNFIAVITSIIWLVPFYFLYFQDPKTYNPLHLGMFGWLLVIFVTFLIIIILSIIDDLDKPFDGFWMVTISSWEDLVEDIKKLRGTDNVPQGTQLPEQRDIVSLTPSVQTQAEPSVDKELEKPVPSQLNTEQPAGVKNPQEIPLQKQDKDTTSLTPAPIQAELPIEKESEKPVVSQLNIKFNIQDSLRQKHGELSTSVPPMVSKNNDKVLILIIKTHFFTLRDYSQNHQKKSRE